MESVARDVCSCRYILGSQPHVIVKSEKADYSSCLAKFDNTLQERQLCMKKNILHSIVRCTGQHSNGVKQSGSGISDKSG